MRVLFSLIVVAAIIGIVLFGVAVLGWRTLFGIVLPYTAIVVFIAGIVYRVIKWASSAVPFRVPTTTGQAKSLPWITHNKVESPYTGWQAVGRVLSEVFLFRSLFRNTSSELSRDKRLVYGSSKWLWLGALVFHWAFLIVFIRHFKYFVEPIPGWISSIQWVDSFFQVGLPVIYMTDGALLAALTYLFLRRVAQPYMRYLSMPGDYFPLLLIGAIAVTGVLMRYTPLRADIVDVKALATGLVTFHPVVPAGISTIFFIHLGLVSSLFIYFPFSKLLHMPGVFMSPTRNLANNNRSRRHINPWNYPVKTHSYEEWEDEFRDVMKAAGLPLEKEE